MRAPFTFTPRTMFGSVPRCNIREACCRLSSARPLRRECEKSASQARHSPTRDVVNLPNLVLPLSARWSAAQGCNARLQYPIFRVQTRIFPCYKHGIAPPCLVARRYPSKSKRPLTMRVLTSIVRHVRSQFPSTPFVLFPCRC